MKKKILEILFYLLLFVILIGLVFVWKNQNRQKEYKNIEIFCDFEKQDENNQFITSNPTYFVAEAKTSKKTFFSGEQSLYIPAWKKYQNILKLNNIEGINYFKISFKIKNGSQAFIVAQGTKNKEFYYRANIPILSSEDEWSDVVLLFETGANFHDTIKLYVLNKELQDTYIDDFSVKITDQSRYPEYTEEEPLLLYIEPQELEKLNIKRNQALKNGILQTDDDSWVSAIVYGENKMMQAEVRLKGDWLDHLLGNKWSFRIKLKDDSWKGMRVFSIQTPLARGFMNEWLMHKTCQDEDVLTGKYDFVPVYLNGKSLGIYAYEEHFRKELIESNKRREGPIIKFSETDFWEFFLNKTPNGYTFRTSVIEPFGSNSILNDSVKLQQFLLASNLLNMYRNMSAQASDIFDVKKMAKFMALLNTRNAFHGLQWHNVRYYYNPVLCRLEPISFDTFAGTEEFTFTCPFTALPTIFQFNYVANSAYYLSNDSVFLNEYLKYIKHYAYEKDYAYYTAKYYSDYVYKESLLKREFVQYLLDTVQFAGVITKIDKYLPEFIDSLNTPNYRNNINELSGRHYNLSEIKTLDKYGDKYLKCYTKSKDVLSLWIYMYRDVTIKGFGSEDKLTKEASISLSKVDRFTVLETDINVSDLSANEDYIYFTIKDIDTIYKTQIVKWPAPTSYNPRNDLASKSISLIEYTDEESKTITFSGDLQFNNHIYIPSSYTVVFEAGANVDFVNKAAFISNSTVLINGTKNKPVNIYSSDKTANGFTVLQAEEKSKINYTIFKDFNTLNYNGWVLTGAVNFYESDVEITNTLFSDNHCEDMLNTIRCDFLIKNCTLKNTFSDSHDSDFCTGTLSNCDFINNGNDAIDFSTSEATIIDCSIVGAGDKGISVGENTQVIITNINIENVNIGIASKDLSHAEIDNCIITGATYGFVLLQKKPEFGPATISAKSCKLQDVWRESLIERKSKLILNGRVYNGNKAKLKALFYE